MPAPLSNAAEQVITALADLCQTAAQDNDSIEGRLVMELGPFLAGSSLKGAPIKTSARDFVAPCAQTNRKRFDKPVPRPSSRQNGVLNYPLLMGEVFQSLVSTEKPLGHTQRTTPEADIQTATIQERLAVLEETVRALPALGKRQDQTPPTTEAPSEPPQPASSQGTLPTLSPAVTPTPRVYCDEDTRSVYLDTKCLASSLIPALFRFFKAIAVAHPDPIRFQKIQKNTTGLSGKHSTRLKNQLPYKLRQLVASSRDGYHLNLPRPN